MALWVLAYSTPLGLGLNDDSIAYIAGARSILAGNGYRAAWLASNGPVTHFPPGFPAVLAFIGLITDLDPVRGARALNGLIVRIEYRSYRLGRLAYDRFADSGCPRCCLILVNSSLLYIHTRAMSEPLYIFLMLVSFLLLGLLFRASTILLVGSARVYAGLGLPGALCSRYPCWQP